MKKLIFIFSFFIICSSCQQGSLDDQSLLAHSENADPILIERHIAVLADDSLRGRLPGTPEYDIAMNYVVQQYKEIGITPLGDKSGSTYFQPITLRNSLVNEEASFMLLNNQDTLVAGEDYFYVGNPSAAESIYQGEVVMGGYGIEAPQFGHNDFEDLDVLGKIVILYSGGPASLPATERAHFSNTNTKIQTLDEKGALGVLFTTFPGARGNFKSSYSRVSNKGLVSVGMPSGEYKGRTDLGDMKFGGYLSWDAVRDITGNEADANLAKYQNGELVQPSNSIRLSGKVVSEFKEFKSSNVVGLLEGAEMKDEYVIHTAHLDHIGVGEPVDGDSIYNGAHDNASGISAMLEIARLYSLLPSKPKRSVIFAAVTAEEMGLLGSRYLAENPVVPENSIVACVNTDMPTLVGPLVSVEPLGAEQSSIMSIVERSTQLLNLTIDADHMPEEVRFVRSDNYNFVLAGIPALRMKHGMKTSDPNQTLDSAYNFVMQNMYHKPSDELGDSFNFDGAKTYVQLQFMNSYLINTADARPTWNEDSFFKRFDR